MNRLTGEHAARLVERQMAMFGAQQRAERSATPAAPQAAPGLVPAPYVTISRQYGADGSAIAREVATRLGWTLYDKELIEAIGKDAHLQGRLLEPFDETARNNLEHWIRGLLTQETLSEHHYTAALFRVLSAIAQVGRAVIVGRGAHLALPAELGLRVRIYAPLDARVAKVCQEEHLDEKEARRRIEKVEQSRQDWLLRAYGQRAKEPFAFDLALNSATLSHDVGVAIILLGLRDHGVAV